jgi:hypothetical protein
MILMKLSLKQQGHTIFVLPLLMVLVGVMEVKMMMLMMLKVMM